MNNIFEEATRKRVRFDCKGQANVEDLWDLTLTSLDSLYKTLNRKLKDMEEDSLLETKSAADRLLQLKVDLVKHVVKVKLEEKEESKKLLEKKAEKEKLLTILADKQDADLRNLSVEDLKKRIEDL